MSFIDINILREKIDLESREIVYILPHSSKQSIKVFLGLKTLKQSSFSKFIKESFNNDARLKEVTIKYENLA